LSPIGGRLGRGSSPRVRPFASTPASFHGIRIGVDRNAPPPDNAAVSAPRNDREEGARKCDDARP